MSEKPMFTPGPFTATPIDELRDPDVIPVRDASGRQIADFYAGDLADQMPIEEASANACLYAAAPDMYEALIAFCNPDKLREAFMMEGTHLSHDLACRIIEEDRLGIRAALAKAEGRDA